MGLAWVVLLGFMRIRCSPRIFVAPLPVAEAAEEVEAWLERPQVQILHPGARHAELAQVRHGTLELRHLGR